MFNRKSSYALNKKDPNAIVYMDANEAIIRLTREDFASEEEFLKWKGRTHCRLYPPDQKSLPLPLRRFRGKRLLCRERCYVRGMSARHFALSDILAFFRRECYDRCGKG